MTIDWHKLGRGIPDAPTYGALRTRVGLVAIPPHAEDPAWDLNALVRSLDYEPKNKPFLVADPSMPSETQGLLMRSAARYADARYLLEAFYPCHDPRYDDPKTVGGCYGCKSDSNVDFGHVYSSKTSLVGFVEGIVSSLANWKLYALDVTHHVWTGELLTLAPGAPFVNPMRPEEEASAGTVLHTAYCSLHLLEWYRAVLLGGPAPYGAEYRHGVWRQRVERSITELDVLVDHTTTDGRELVLAMQAWGMSLLAEEGQ